MEGRGSLTSRPATVRSGESVAVVCPKPRGRQGGFWTPQSQIVVCPWAEKSFLAYFDKVLFCRTASGLCLATAQSVG